ncbi:MAG: hypothetical protein GX030_05270 [Firmicutes bacterium]|nr:hypothetical protein [Bacillota bacterium]
MDRVNTLRKILPEIDELLERRYAILRAIGFAQPIGRRSLATQVQMSERMVRNEVEILIEQGLVATRSTGMRITEDGRRILEELEEPVRHLRGLFELEQRLAQRLQLDTVIIVPGDSDIDSSVKQEMAKVTAKYLIGVLRDGLVLAVTGGTTLAEVSRSFPPVPRRFDITVVPTRGGLGEEVEKQANTVAAGLAQHLGARYRLLHVPDDIGAEALQSLASEPKIAELLALIKGADIVVHGIGTAEEMARRRGMSSEEIQRLKELGAVGEAFGYYFDRHGRIVYATSSLGMRMEDLDHVDVVIAVGGGKSKAEAALAVMSNRYQRVWITDEGAARQMLDLVE